MDCGERRSTAGNAPPSWIPLTPQRSTTSPWPTSTKVSWTKAREAYEKALALEPNNPLIRQNYDLFKEINDRAAQKDGRQP